MDEADPRAETVSIIETRGYSERLVRRWLALMLCLGGMMAITTIGVALWIVPTGEDSPPLEPTDRPARPDPARAYATMLERCAESQAWAFEHAGTGASNAWETFTRLHTTRVEMHYCQQWLGGQVMGALLGTAATTSGPSPGTPATGTGVRR